VSRTTYAPDRVDRAVHGEHHRDPHHEERGEADAGHARGVAREGLHVLGDDLPGDLRHEVQQQEDLQAHHHGLEERHRGEHRHRDGEHRHEREQRGEGERRGDLRAAVLRPAAEHEAQEPEGVEEFLQHGRDRKAAVS
jgi:hypothetical protein